MRIHPESSRIESTVLAKVHPNSYPPKPRTKVIEKLSSAKIRTHRDMGDTETYIHT